MKKRIGAQEGKGILIFAVFLGIVLLFWISDMLGPTVDPTYRGSILPTGALQSFFQEIGNIVDAIECRFQYPGCVKTPY